ICERCARIRGTVERQLPMMEVTWWTTHSPERDTPLSAYLHESGIVGSHEHSWRFIHGAGNGVSCAIGRGQQLVWTSERQDVIDFLRFLRSHETPETLSRWLSFILDSRTAHKARTLLYRLANYPDLPQAWWNEQFAMEAEREAAIQEEKRYPP